MRHLLLLLIVIYAFTTVSTSYVDIMRDFKGVLMFYAEPFLKGVEDMEGEDPVFAASKIVKAIEGIESRSRETNIAGLNELAQFKTALFDGSIVTSNIQSAALLTMRTSESLCPAHIKGIQNSFLDRLEKSNYIVLPTGWKGHAIAMSFKLNSLSKTVDLAVHNTGEGIDFHFHSPDPNGVYPFLSRTWISFKDIPFDEIFEESAWFFYGLVELKGKLADTIKKSNETSVPEYFYNSFLGNFSKYLVPVSDAAPDTSKHIPMQRSGSCTISSILAALLYHSESAEIFHLHRLKIGHTLLHSLLNQAYSDANFVEIISDGFRSEKRTLFRSLASNLAQQTLQYLEVALPNEFKHSGLIGLERSAWLYEKRPLAIRALHQRMDITTHIQISAQLGKEIFKFLDNVPISADSTKLSSKSESMKRASSATLSRELYDKHFVPMKVPESSVFSNISEHLSGSPIRHDSPITTLSEFASELANYSKTPDKSSQFFFQVADVFHRSGPEWWKLIDTAQDQDKAIFLNILKSLKKISRKLFSDSNETEAKASFDNLALFANIQLASWKAAVKYDELSDSKISLKSLNPPGPIFKLLKDGEMLLPTYNSWFINNIHSTRSISSLTAALKEWKNISRDGSETFIGPEKCFTRVISDHDFTFSDYMKNMLDSQIVNEAYQEKITTDHTKPNVKKSWEDISENKAKIALILSSEKAIVEVYPHFYELMDILTNIYIGASSSRSGKFDFDINLWTWPLTMFGPVKPIIQPNFKNFIKISPSPTQIIADSKLDEVFYIARHSFALTEQIAITNIETWLNYVKLANSAKIFDSPYFQYMTDHLLNVPKEEEFDSESMEFKMKIDPRIIPEISNSMIRLVGISLNRLKEKQHILDGQGRTIIVNRAANISILVSRFISRVDKDELLTGNECAQFLANLYNTIVDYANFSSDLELTDPDISRLNFALCYVCSNPLRNSLHFMEALKLDMPHISFKLRRTLEKYHWFAAKTNYLISKLGESISDDQFDYGIVERPLCPDETPFLEALLQKFFLPSVGGTVDFDEFKYHSDGFKVEARNLSIKSEYVIINLSSGAIVRSGLTVIKSNEFLNTKAFRDFFNAQDRSLLANGISVKAAGRSVYALPDYKGSSYLIVNHNTILSFYTTIHRKWGNNWYTLSLSNDLLKYHIGYNWTHNMKIFARINNDSDEKEIILFASDEDLDPIFRVPIIKSKIGLKVKDMYEVNEPWMLISNDTIIVDRHIRSFVEDDFIQFKDVESNRSGAIYPGYRLLEDPLRPLTIIQESNEEVTGFKVLNLPGLVISPDQSLHDDSSLSGTLIAELDSKKIILLPHVENRTKKIEKRSSISVIRENLIQIQTIPILEGMPCPQSRYQKILLAYYYILAYNYNSARELLHPSASLHQNDAFSVSELEVLSWIVQVDYSAPESTALKLLVLMLFMENSAKFPVEYKTRAKLIEPLVKIIALATKEAFSYLLSIREVSEKFYIYRMYPKILNESAFNYVFADADSILRAPSFSNNLELEDILDLIVSGTALMKSKWEVGNSISYEIFIKFMLGRFPDKLLHLAKYFVHRSKGTKSIAFELAVHCLASDPKIWDRVKSAYSKQTIPSDKYLLRFELKQAMDVCKTRYYDDFKGVNQSLKSSITGLEKIRLIMQADLNHFTFEIKDSTDFTISLVSKAEIDKIISFKDKLELLIKNDVHESSARADDQYLEGEGSVLKKLSEAIEAFKIEKGPNRLAEVNLTQELKKELAEFDTYFVDKVGLLKRLQIESETDLSTSIQNDSHPKIFDSLVSLMHKRKTKTFSGLYTCYFGNYSSMLACIQRKFPQLSLEECAELKTKAFVFFSRKILLDYYSMLHSFTQSFIKNALALSVDDLTIFCDELDKISDFNERILSPVVMNFEFRSAKYRLKREQVKDIALLTSIDPRTRQFKSTVIQRMMAAGKTLVLGTISVVTKALDDAKLSILVPPSSLYQSNTTAMQNRTYHYFKKKGKNFSFPRFNLPSSNSKSVEMVSKYLQTVKDVIIETMQSKNYLILSPDSLHSFLNSYSEVIMNAKDNHRNTEYLAILKNYAWIYRVFKSQSSIILDEIDMTMDPKKELNFPTTDSEPYNMIAAAMISDIMEFLVFDRSVIEEVNLHIHANNQASLTPENYIKCRQMILDYIEVQLGIAGSIWYRFVFNGSRHKAEVGRIMSFLRNPRMSSEPELVQMLIETKEEQLANALIIVKTQLYQYLEDSLKGTVNQNFGSAGKLRPSIKYAVPYVAANTPSPASVFADRWETLLKTLLMVSAVPCSKELVVDIIAFVRKSIVHESAGVNPFESTATYKNLKLILPEDLNPTLLDKDNHCHIDSLWKVLSLRSPAAIRILYGFFMNQVFKAMTFPTEQITSNALNMTSMFGSIQGYSGTIDNVNILPQVVVKEAYEDHLLNEKNNGGIALKLMKDFDNVTVPELSGDSFSKGIVEMIRDLVNLYASDDVGTNLSAIIDTGAYFKNFKNYQVAEAILDVFSARIEAVLYYDEDSNQLEFVRRSVGSAKTRGFLDTTDPEDIRRATQAELEKRFTFYDQRHITGSDILQFKTARAILTVGSRVLLRDILQGTLRMRQFMTSQKVHLVTTTSTRLFYASKIGKTNLESVKISDMLSLGSLNEDDKQRHENEKLAFVKIDAEIRSFVLDEISRHLLASTSELDFIVEMFESTQSLFVRSIRENPLSWLHDSKKDNTIEILDRFARSRLSPLKRIMEKRFDRETSVFVRFNSLKGRIIEMISEDRKNETDSLLHHLPEQIKSRIDIENGNEVQMQTLTLTLVDLNMDQLVDQTQTNVSAKYYDMFGLIPELEKESNSSLIEASRNSNAKNFLSLSEVFSTDIERNEIYLPYLNSALLTAGRRVGVSRDMVQLYQESVGMKKYPIFSKYTLEASHLLIQVLPGEIGVRIILLSPAAASKVFTSIVHGRNLNSQYWLCDLTGRVTATTNVETRFGENVMDFIPIIHDLVFDALIFNGSLTQILNCPVLKSIYYDRWLSADSFSERATFLLLRMRILMSKDSIMFDDDDQDYAKLKRFARGDRHPDSADGFSEGYAKIAVTREDQRLCQEIIGICHSVVLDSSCPVISREFDLNAEIMKLFEVDSLNNSRDKTFQYNLVIYTNGDVEGNLDDSEVFKEPEVSSKIHFRSIPLCPADYSQVASSVHDEFLVRSRSPSEVSLCDIDFDESIPIETMDSIVYIPAHKADPRPLGTAHLYDEIPVHGDLPEIIINTTPPVIPALTPGVAIGPSSPVITPGVVTTPSPGVVTTPSPGVVINPSPGVASGPSPKAIAPTSPVIEDPITDPDLDISFGIGGGSNEKQKKKFAFKPSKVKVTTPNYTTWIVVGIAVICLLAVLVGVLFYFGALKTENNE